MQAVILAAGQSSRFYPFSHVAHKALITMMGKTLLEHTLESLKRTGVIDIIIVVGKNNIIEHIVGDGSSMGLSITYVVQPEPLGMGDALLQAGSVIKEDFFLLHAYHLEFAEFGIDMLRHKKNDDIVLLGKEVVSTDRYGYMYIDRDRVTGIIEKPNETLQNALHVIGVYLLNKQFLETLKITPLSHYHFEEALNAYAKMGKATYVKTDKKSLTLKYVWDLLDIKDYLLEHIDHFISPEAEVSEHAIISGKVHIEAEAKIFEGACIKGPCYIGKGVVVGNNALVRNGIMAEAESVIGSYMEMKNTLLMQGATTHSGFIGDSIVGNNSKIGGGICTTNVRLDRQTILPEIKENKVSSYRNHLGVIIGDNVIIGARVTTMPGVIIGNDTLIGPSTNVLKNVRDNVKFYTEFMNIEKEKK